MASSLTPVADCLKACRGAFAAVAVYSGAINILMLTGSLFMLRVYDRGLPSHSVPTLVGLLVIVVVLYAARYSFAAAIRSLSSWST
jgi:ATP-binding cassette subfamily C protein